MKPCRIRVMRISEYKDLMAQYELPLKHACDMKEGMEFITDGEHCPKGFCESAWMSLYPFVMTLSCGGTHIFGNWMKNQASAMVSCNDGFRPVSFLIEVIQEDEANEKV